MKKPTPAQLLCNAIASKTNSFCGNRPDAFIFAPKGFLQKEYRSFRSMDTGLKIYIELRTGSIGAYYDKLYHRDIFLINISYITDYENIICQSSYRDKHNLNDTYNVYTNLYVSVTQVSNFIREFLCYLHFGVISLRTISNTSMLTTNSAFSYPDEFSFWRFVASARI